MAYYQDAPGNRNAKKNHASGSWADEGTQYRSGRRFGPESDGDRPRRRPDDYRDGRASYAKNRDKGPDDRRYDSRSEDRPPRGRKPNGAYAKYDRPLDRPGDRRDKFRDDRRPSERPAPRRPLPQQRPAPSYRDSEYHPPVRPVEPVMPVVPVAPMVEADVSNENLLAGRNPIREALKSGRDIEKLLVQRGELSGSAREIVQMARNAHIPVQEVERVRLDELAQHHQGMIAFASAYQYSTVEAMLAEAAEKGEAPFLILLDGVTDPHNLGAIIRTAECVGAHGVIVPERRAVGLTPAAVKASAGAVEHVKVARVVNLTRTIADLKARNIWTYALTMDGTDYEQVDLKGGVALVIGSEGEGISRLALESCDERVSLPMMGQLDSLNASVAAGVMMYRVLSSRRA